MAVNIGAELQALPLGFVLSAPLTAAIEAQALSAGNTIDFINTLGADEFGKLRTMKFDYETNVNDPSTGTDTTRTINLTVPVLAMVEAPHISIEDLTVGFEFHIRDVVTRQQEMRIAGSATTETTFSNENQSNVSGNIGGFYKFLFGKVSASYTNSNRMTLKASMKVSSAYQRSERHETDRRATLKMNMTAKQRIPEGFQRVLTIFADAISAQVALPNPAPAPTPSPGG